MSRYHQLDVTVKEVERTGKSTPVEAVDSQQKKKSKPPVDKSRKVVLRKQFLTYLRPTTFDTKNFKKGHKTVYEQEEGSVIVTK